MARTVGTRELKTRLGTYLRLVKSGRTLIVTDRGRPVAQLGPVTKPEDRLQAILEQMEAEGKVTLPKGKGKPGRFRPIRPKKGAPSVAELISEDREDRL